MSGSFQEFELVVRDIWPGYRANIQPIWDRRLREHPFDRLIGVLNEHRANEPDETRPRWKMIYGMLADGQGSGGKSELQILLDGVRRAISRDPSWQKRRPVNTWPDADVLDNHIEANVRPILRNLDGTMSEDPEGRLAKMAAFRRRCIVERLIRDLEERGDPIPTYLVR